MLKGLKIAAKVIGYLVLVGGVIGTGLMAVVPVALCVEMKETGCTWKEAVDKYF